MKDKKEKVGLKLTPVSEGYWEGTLEGVPLDLESEEDTELLHELAGSRAKAVLLHMKASDKPKVSFLEDLSPGSKAAAVVHELGHIRLSSIPYEHTGASGKLEHYVDEFAADYWALSRLVSRKAINVIKRDIRRIRRQVDRNLGVDVVPELEEEAVSRAGYKGPKV